MRVVSAAAAFVALLAPPAGAARPLGDGRMAVTPNGQQVCQIEGGRGSIIGFAPRQPEVSHDIVGPLAEPVFAAVAFIAGDVVAAVCREGDAWSLRTYRTQPGSAVDASDPLQVIALGEATGDADGVDIAASHARGWLAIAGLPPPLPPVQRAVLAGVRVGPLSDRGCPVPPAGCRPVAVAVSPADELVLVLRREDDPAEDQLAFYDLTGRELLRLPVGLRDTVGLDFGRGDGLLWAAATHADGRGGLWRLDAAFADGRQVVRPALVSALAKPRDVAAASPRAVVISHGEPAGSVAWIDPTESAPPGVLP
jgi:hypothetical protein